MNKYTFYVVTRNANDHYPVLIANNGKIPFNESVGRANKLEKSFSTFLDAANWNGVAIVRISHAEFKKKFPHYAKNAGKKKAKP